MFDWLHTSHDNAEVCSWYSGVRFSARQIAFCHHKNTVLVWHLFLSLLLLQVQSILFCLLLVVETLTRTFVHSFESSGSDRFNLIVHNPLGHSNVNCQPLHINSQASNSMREANCLIVYHHQKFYAVLRFSYLNPYHCFHSEATQHTIQETQGFEFYQLKFNFTSQTFDDKQVFLQSQ